jgi:hypothetical protein
MKNETATTMYESARERLQELLRRETEIKEQITGWIPVVEQLAILCGEKMDAELLKRVNLAKSGEPAGPEMGLTEAIRWVFRQPLLLPLTPTQGKGPSGADGV